MLPAYYQDGFAAIFDCSFFQEPRFVQAYQAAEQLGGWPDPPIYVDQFGLGATGAHWRVYINCWAGVIGSKLEGDFVECGVNNGSTAMAVMEFVQFVTLGKQFFLMDLGYGSGQCSVKGVSNPGLIDGQKFARFGNAVRIARGANIFEQMTAQKVAYLAIDMNDAELEITAAHHFWPRLSTGAVVLLDDYGCPGHMAQKLAIDAFAHSKGTQVLSLPTGQGLIIKQ
ncbi:MAG: hypothetical protein H7838_12940 [Magnetococcus sp. DMHC-8]